MRFIDRYLGKEAGLFFEFHRNRYAFLSLSLTFVHQVCIGLSVVSLIYLSEGIAKESEEYIAWFYAYLFLMVFPYIPGVLSQYYLGVWTNDLYIRFVKIASRGRAEKYDKAVRRNLRYSQVGLFAISNAAVIPTAAILVLTVHRNQGDYIAVLDNFCRIHKDHN